jgi:hypothetical protein
MEGIIKALPIAAIMWLIGFEAFGETKTIRMQLSTVQGENGITCKDGRALFHKVQGFYRRNFNVNLHLSRSFCEGGNIFGVETLGDRHWGKITYYWGQRYLGHNMIQHSIIPPIKDAGIYYIGGFANGHCEWKRGWGVSVSNAGRKRSNGLPFDNYNFYAFVHEIGHQLGAKHDDSEYGVARSYMHSAALPYAPNLVISDRNRKEINKCVGRR